MQSAITTAYFIHVHMIHPPTSKTDAKYFDDALLSEVIRDKVPTLSLLADLKLDSFGRRRVALCYAEVQQQLLRS